jgi:hypothetical protein
MPERLESSSWDQHSRGREVFSQKIERTHAPYKVDYIGGTSRKNVLLKVRGL